MYWYEKSRFALGLNVAKSSNYIKKSVKQKLIKIIEFPTRNSVNAYL